MFNLNNIIYYRNSLQSERAKLNNRLSTIPDAYLTIQMHGTRKPDLYLHVRSPEKQVFEKSYVNKAMLAQAQMAADGMLIRSQLADVDNKIEALDGIIQAFQGTSAVDNLFQEKPWIIPMLTNYSSNEEKQIQWKNEPYERNKNHPEDLTHNTIVPSLITRSKSEADIVMLLEKYGVPYHYDEIKNLNGVLLAIDFICLNVRTGKIWYWDHRGMMDDKSYINKTLYCEQQFLNAGIIQGINLIVTSETSAHPFDILEAEALIQLYLL